MNLRTFLLEPELRGMDVESSARMALHAKIFERKKMLREVFEEFYHTCITLDERFFGDTPGLRVELGAGVSRIKKLYPDVMVTDAESAPNLDRIVDAHAMPFKDGSVRALYGLYFFHHLADPERFFKEALRVLAPGGGCVFMEPYWGPVASVFYKHLHATEGYDTSEKEWGSAGRGTMKDANQALSYLIFERDRERYEKLFPDLELVYQKPQPNYLRQGCSGGLNFRQLLPSWCSAPLKVTEKILSPFVSVLALTHFLVLRKRAN